MGRIQNRQQIGNAHVGQVPGEHVPEDHVVHRTGIFGRLPDSGAYDGIGGFEGGINDCLNVLFAHKQVIGRSPGLFSLVRNRLPGFSLPGHIHSVTAVDDGVLLHTFGGNGIGSSRMIPTMPRLFANALFRFCHQLGMKSR